jgi:NADH dehydrogenase
MSSVGGADNPTAAAGSGPGTARYRVVIIGAGFGGLFATRALRWAPVEVTVVDRTNHHLFQPLHDSVIVAAGAAQSYFGHDEFAVDAPGMKTIDDALELRGRIFGAFEMAELESEPTQRDAWLTFVVVGAGPTGVELAGQIAELRAGRSSATTAPSIPRPLASSSLRPPTPCSRPSPSGLDIKQENQSTGRIQAYTKIWAAGVQASPLGRILAEHSDATVDRAGRVSVLPDTTLPGHPEVFVVGDLMSVDHLPGVAEVAIQSGIHAAHTITRRLSGDTGQRPFRYRDLATIARFRAVVFIGRVHLTGFAAWLMWLVVHLVFLTGFKNRVAAVTNWAVAFLGHDRRQRTITEQQVFARTREVKQPEAVAPDRAFLERPSGRGCR